MIVFQLTMDPHSLDIIRLDSIAKDKHEKIGMLQWHSEREPRVVLSRDSDFLTIKEMMDCVSKFIEILPAEKFVGWKLPY
jgi:hypothetical protein